jgi:hypothetical protein
MTATTIDRKHFVAALGAASCMCAAVSGMRAALAEEPPPAPPSKPGERTPERAVKRMEFVDGWVKRFFDVVDHTLDPEVRNRLMEANGAACFAAYAGPPAHPPGPDALARFTAWIADKGAASGYAMDGNTISFTYLGSAETGQAAPAGVCLCPMVEAQSAGSISPTYCLCSVGYVREMHRRLLGRPLQVELVDSVLKGAQRCSFRITLV